MDEKPSVYLLYGDDLFSIKRIVDAMQSRLGDAGLIELNLTRLHGPQTSEDQLRNACYALPFLGERRLVVYTEPLAKLTADASRKRFLQLLENLPATTALVLIVEDQYLGKTKGWETLKETHWLKKWVAGRGKRVYVKEFALPRQDEMAVWIVRQAKEQGGVFSPQAAAFLAEHVGNDTHFAVQEISKLLAYVDHARAVGIADVTQLTPAGQHGNIFEMVDALANRDLPRTLKTLDLLLMDAEPQYLFSMMVRQFRLLLLTKEIANEGGTLDQIAAELHQMGFVAQKLLRQAQKFTMAELEAIYHRLLTLDEALKFSASSPAALLVSFVAEIAS